MPAGNFDEKLEIRASDGVVIAAGPLDKSVASVTEMCVWVLQRDTGGAEDAIGNNMGPPGGDPPCPGEPAPTDVLTVTLGTANQRWNFPLAMQFKPAVKFRPGAATAWAIGIFCDTAGTQRALFWSETVWLVPEGSAMAQASS